MTHHPVTKEELEQIRELAYNDNCITISRMIDTILVRPDPLEVLEKWMRYESTRGFATQSHTQIVIWSCGMMDAIRNNPDAVNKRGKDEGWLP